MQTSDALALLNTWWTSGKSDKELSKEYRRAAFDDAYSKLIKYKEIIILTGLRRVGKSTIMYQMIEELLKTENSINIVYFTFDYASSELKSILDSYRAVTGVDWKKERIYIFLDEIQKLENWSSQLKLLHDAFPKMRIIISGSASLQLEKNAIDDLAGRHFLINIPVLSIIEYYSLKHKVKIANINLHKSELDAEFGRYIKKPFPKLVDINDDKIIYEYINESVVSKVTNQDLPEEFKKVDIILLRSLVDLFYSEPGMILNVDSLSGSFGKRKQEVERHIHLLEFSKLIKILKNYRPSSLSESRKLRKVYPYDISLALSQNPSLDAGHIFESLMVSRLDAKRYWRDGKREVDILIGTRKGLIPIEVKAGSKLKDEYKVALNYFIDKFKVKHGIIIYNGAQADSAKIKAINIKDVLIYGIEKFIEV